jgi:hypothetical protein
MQPANQMSKAEEETMEPGQKEREDIETLAELQSRSQIQFPVFPPFESPI